MFSPRLNILMFHSGSHFLAFKFPIAYNFIFHLENDMVIKNLQFLSIVKFFIQKIES